MSKRRKRRRRDNSKCKLDECVYLFVQILIISVGNIYRINKTKVTSASLVMSHNYNLGIMLEFH